MVIVYSVEECPWCHKVKKYLDKLQVGYEERNIDYNEEYANECIKISGDNLVPVTTIDGEEYVVGFDKEKLDKLLCL